MYRASVIDAHQWAVIETDDEVARIGDAAEAIEGEAAGEHDDDAERTENLVANGHLEKSPAVVCRRSVRHFHRHLHARMDRAEHLHVAGLLEGDVGRRTRGLRAQIELVALAGGED